MMLRLCSLSLYSMFIVQADCSIVNVMLSMSALVHWFNSRHSLLELIVYQLYLADLGPHIVWLKWTSCSRLVCWSPLIKTACIQHTHHWFVRFGLECLSSRNLWLPTQLGGPCILKLTSMCRYALWISKPWPQIHIHTPGQFWTSDLQGVRLTSWRLDHRCMGAIDTYQSNEEHTGSLHRTEHTPHHE